MELTRRINRIIGQLKGIQKMSEKGRDCTEILQQISAVKKAIDGLSRELVLSDIGKYIPKDQALKIEKLVQQAIDL